MHTRCSSDAFTNQLFLGLASAYADPRCAVLPTVTDQALNSQRRRPASQQALQPDWILIEHDGCSGAVDPAGACGSACEH